MSFLRNCVAAVLITGFFLALISQQAGQQPGVESHYHYRLAGEIASGSLTPNPGAHLPLGALGSAHPVDHHWGLHLLISPFAALGSWLDNDALGMAAASLFFAVVSVLGLYLLIQASGGAMAELFCLLPLVFGTILWRQLQLRGGGVMAVGLLVLCLITFRRALPLAAGVLAALLMWTYHGAFLFFPLSCAALLTLWILGAHRSPRIPLPVLKACGASWLGGFFALVVGPYGPGALRFLVYHLSSSFGDPQSFYAQGHEFSPFDLAMLAHFPEYFPGLLALLGLGVYCVKARRSLSVYAVALIAMTGALAVLSWRSQRMVEYTLPFLAVSLSVVCAPLIEGSWPPHWPSRRFARISLAIILLLGIGRSVLETRRVITQHTTPSDAYKPAAQILQNAPGVIGNLYQGDFALILWAHPGARCLQGLNHYFTHHDKEVGGAVETLKKGKADGEMRKATRVLHDKGVSLFTQRSRAGGHLRPFGEYAEAHPELFQRVYGDSTTFARIWLLRQEP